MEESKEMKDKAWKSIPKFGEWDKKGVYPDYSLDFSKIREMKKYQKNDLSIPSSYDNENETSLKSQEDRNHPSSARRGFLSYFGCYGKA